MKLIEIMLFVILILAAFYSFDWNSRNGILIPVLLCCAAVNLLLLNPRSEFQKNLKRLVNSVSLVLVMVLVLRVLIFG